MTFVIPFSEIVTKNADVIQCSTPQLAIVAHINVLDANGNSQTSFIGFEDMCLGTDVINGRWYCQIVYEPKCPPVAIPSCPNGEACEPCAADENCDSQSLYQWI